MLTRAQPYHLLSELGRGLHRAQPSASMMARRGEPEQKSSNRQVFNMLYM